MFRFLVLITAALLLISSAPALAARKAPNPKATESGGEPVSFTTADGFKLLGDFYKGKQGAPSVLLLHQLGTDRSEFEGLARLLQQKGMNVLAYDARGHGKSVQKDGKAVKWEGFDAAEFSRMTLDIDAALKFLRSQKKTGKGPLGIVGASIQSSTGLVFAASHPEITALVMLSPGLSYHEIDTASPMKQYGRRPLFLAASIDDAYSYKSAKELERLAEGPKRFEVLSNAGHGAGMFRKDPKLMEKVADWLSANLG